MRQVVLHEAEPERSHTRLARKPARDPGLLQAELLRIRPLKTIRIQVLRQKMGSGRQAAFGRYSSGSGLEVGRVRSEIDWIRPL